MITDARICALPLSHRWLFLSLLLICGDHACDTVTLTERQVNDALTVRVGAENALQVLQEFQLVTFEKTLLKKEKKRKEDKERKEKKSAGVAKTDTRAINSEVWASYRDAYFNRYKIEPIRNAKTNTAISQLASRLGSEAIDVVRFYLSHNDSFYIKNMHDIGHCLANAESLRTQFLKGRAVTSQQVRNFEKTISQVDLIRDAKEGGF